jgi:molecular chaperone GrpE (heat shock protein)
MQTEEQKKIADLEAELKKAQASFEKAKTQNKALKVANESGAPLPVEGTFEVVKSEKGEAKTVKYGFKDGHKFIRDNQSTIFLTEGVIKIANTGKIDEETAEQYTTLKSLTKESAQAILQHLADLEYTGLKNA